MINYRWRFLPLLVLILSLTGCATTKLWSKANHNVYESTAVATGLEIYGENPSLIDKYDYPKVGIKYTAVKKIKDNNSFPPYHDGCIILERFYDSSRFLVGLESLLQATPRSKINYIKAVISHRGPQPGHGPTERMYNLRLGLALQPVCNDFFDETGKPPINSSWSPFLGRAPSISVAQTAPQYGKKRYYPPLDSYIIPDNSDKDTLYFLIGGPSGGGPSGSAQLIFNNECVIQDNFIPLLRDDKILFTIQFVEEEKAMKFPLGARIIFTPFAVAFDVLTSPIQVLLILTLGQIGYS